MKTESLDNTKCINDIENISWKDIVPTSDEYFVYKKSLLGRIISMFASKFDWMKSVLPQPLQHVQGDAMSQEYGGCRF